MILDNDFLVIKAIIIVMINGELAANSRQLAADSAIV